jgi:DNA polymerase III subunit chi
MTRIDFHSNIPDKIGYACRLVRKARAANCQVVLLASDAQHVARLDAALWSFSELDFLPHVMADDALAASTPVILTDNATTDLPHHQILINLTTSTPAHFARFERLFEVISSEDDDKLAGRERYRFYQQRGYPLTHFVADKT